jgi:hypothetical protein
VKTGEAQDERVERVVPEQALETHEEAAESFLMLSSGLALIVAAGLVRGRVGGVARMLGTAGAVGLIVLAVSVGHSGGKLVYQYGAASAYTGPKAHSNADVERVSAAPTRREPNEEDDR